MVFFDWEKGKLEGVDYSCIRGDVEEVQIDIEVYFVLLQFVVKEFFIDMGFLFYDDEVLVGVREVL